MSLNYIPCCGILNTVSAGIYFIQFSMIFYSCNFFYDIERGRERQREIERGRERQRETERDRDRERDRETERDRERQRETERQREIERDRETDTYDK